MNDLVQITKQSINGAEVNSVNARELHRLLLLKSDFSTWIKKELQLFTENVDYIMLHKKVERQILIEYIITIDTAKHLSMIQRNEKGKEWRDYFIEIEKQSNKPLTIEQLLQENMKVISNLQNKVIEMKPKALFADSVAQSQGSILIGQFAKLISDDTFKIGQNKLFEWLRINNYLCAKGTRYNQPYQKYIDNNYFEVIERTINEPNGSVRITMTTKVTGLGQVKLTSKIKGLKYGN